MNIHELRELCDCYLAYLTDDGFYIDICYIKNLYLDITKDDHLSTFTYSEIMDYLIPFLIILKDDYTISIEIQKKGNQWFNGYNLDYIISERSYGLDIDIEILCIGLIKK